MSMLAISTDVFYNSREWREARARVKTRDGRRCTVARLLGGECSDRLDVHHIESLEDRPGLALDLDNLASVCSKHHPTWERLRRELSREPKIPPCRHRHPYRTGRLACLNQRRRLVGLPPVDIWARDDDEAADEPLSRTG